MEIEVKQEKPLIKERHTNHILVKLKTPPAVDRLERQPLVIGLAIDKSWSMKGDKIDSTIEAACSLVNWLTRHDYITIVAYSADVQVVQPLVQLKDKSAVIDKIRSIQVATSTNLSGGWLQTLKILEAANIPNAYRRAILLTDGQATLGIKEPAQFNQIATDHFSRGISTTTIGFGEDFNESSLREIAVNGGGNFYFISSPEQTSEIFFREFGDIGALYSQATEVQLKFAAGVRMQELFNEVPHSIGNDDTVTIQVGDIRSDDTKNLVLAVDVPADIPNSSDNIVSVNASFYNLFEKMRLDKVSGGLSISNALKSKETDREVLVEWLVASSAKTAFKAAKLIKENEINTAKIILGTAITRVEENINLSQEILSPVLNRLRNMELKLKENAQNASKHFMAEGTDIYGRTDMIDTGGVEVHDRVFEYKTDGDIDLYKCPDIKTTIQTQMKEGYRFIIFDLTETKFIDSSAIGTFIQIVGWLRKRGGEFIVANISDSVRKVFSITRLENHIRVTNSMDEARDVVNSILAATHRV